MRRSPRFRSIHLRATPREHLEARQGTGFGEAEGSRAGVRTRARHRMAAAGGVLGAVGLVAGMLQIGAVLPAAAASGTSYLVNASAPANTPADCLPNATPTTVGNICSLSSAIEAVEANTAANGPYTINFITGTATYTDAPYDILATLPAALTINGNGTGSTFLNGTGTVQIFNIAAGVTPAVTIQKLTIENGDGTTAPGGGGVYNDSNLTLSTVNITNSVGAGNPGAGIYNDSSGTLSLTNVSVTGSSGSSSGGGIYNTGSVTSAAGTTPLTVSTNSATRPGGGIFNNTGATFTTAGVVMANNSTGGAGNGGAIDNSGTFTITGTTSSMTGNSATGNDGGAIANESGGTFTGNGITATNNSATNGGAIANEPGAVSLSISNSTLGGATPSLANSATTDGGGVYNHNHTTPTTATALNTDTIENNTAAVGAGVWNDGPLNITNGSISNNIATGNGGGLWNGATTPITPPTITGVTISGNQSSADGGGIDDTGGGMTVDPTTISGNTATTDGGGVFISTTLTNNQDTFSGDTISGNTAHVNGGGIALETNGGLVIDASGTTGTTISGNFALGGDGAGLYLTSTASATCNVAVTPPGGPSPTVPTTANNTCVEPGTVITGNQASVGNGGGIALEGGTLQITGSTALPTTISSNVAANHGGGIADGITAGGEAMSVINSTIKGNEVSSPTGQGGGIYGGFATSPFSIVYDSTIQNNSVPNATSGGTGYGAGLYNAYGFTLTNDTFDGNGGASFGGGIYQGDTTTPNSVVMTNLTFTLNDTNTMNGGPAYYGAAGTTSTALGSIFAGDENFTTSGTQQDECGTGGVPPTSLGYNLDAEHSCGFASLGDQTGSNTADLQPIANNGGPTQTVALGPTSTAINGDGISNPSVCPTFDQRGDPRNATTRGKCDIGAYDTGGTGGVVGGAPGQPTGLSATPGNGSASFTWTAPATGGAPTSYTVSCTPSGTSTVNGSPPATSTSITGLNNGTTYTCTVTAANGAGSGPTSASTTVTPTNPTTAPGAPTGLTASPGNGSATFNWSAPASNGGSALTSYTVTCSPSGTTTVSGSPPPTTATITGLTNGTSYACTVSATNSVGTGPSSSPVSVTPSASANLPGAPTGLTAVAGNAQATFTWTAPSSNGGSAITSYTVNCSPSGSASVTGSPPPTTATITGLTNGTAYTCTVVATNANGSGPASSSTTVTPQGSSTTTTASVNPPATSQGSTVTYTANVTGGTTTPTGTVAFTAAGTATCTATLTNGSGSCTSAAAPQGTDTVTATYSGDTTHNPSTGTTTLVVNTPSTLVATSTSVSVAPSTVNQGATVTYSASVSGGATAPSGTVSFTAGGVGTCTATISGGSGSCTSNAAPAGSDTVVGTYSGDSTHQGSSGSTTLTVNVPPPPPVNTPCVNAGYSGNSAFVCEAYLYLLRRMPDTGGLGTYLNLLNQGVSRTQVALDIVTSQEYRIDFINAVFINFLGRGVDPGGLNTYLNLMNHGTPEQQVIADVVGSTEFYNRAGGTNSGFVTLAYELILGRVPDSSGFATFTSALNSGQSTTTVANDLLSSNEYHQDTVNFFYQYFLGRAPDPSGNATQVGYLNSGGTIEQLLANIVGSQEFFNDANV